jgi:hypothetical protein
MLLCYQANAFDCTETSVRNNPETKRAFALGDLLDWFAIAIVTGAIASAALIPGLADARKLHCRYNMITIANMMRIHKINDPNHEYATSVADLKDQTPPVPTCPDGGRYTISISDGTTIAHNGRLVPEGVPIVSCSSPSHGKYALDIDIN